MGRFWHALNGAAGLEARRIRAKEEREVDQP